MAEKILTVFGKYFVFVFDFYFIFYLFVTTNKIPYCRIMINQPFFYRKNHPLILTKLGKGTVSYIEIYFMIVKTEFNIVKYFYHADND